MARGDVLLVSLPDSDKREEKGNRPAIAVQTDVAVSPVGVKVSIVINLDDRPDSFIAIAL